MYIIVLVTVILFLSIVSVGKIIWSFNIKKSFEEIFNLVDLELDGFKYIVCDNEKVRYYWDNALIYLMDINNEKRKIYKTKTVDK